MLYLKVPTKNPECYFFITFCSFIIKIIIKKIVEINLAIAKRDNCDGNPLVTPKFQLPMIDDIPLLSGDLIARFFNYSILKVIILLTLILKCI